jgi:hypothetical protein
VPDGWAPQFPPATRSKAKAAAQATSRADCWSRVENMGEASANAISFGPSLQHFEAINKIDR